MSINGWAASVLSWDVRFPPLYLKLVAVTLYGGVVVTLYKRYIIKSSLVLGGRPFIVLGGVHSQ